MLPDASIPDKDLVLYSQCPYSYYLSRMEGKTKIPVTAVSAEVLFFLSKRRSLFEVRDERIGVLFEGQRRAGPLLTDIEDMTREELERFLPFSSAEAFGGSLKGTWAMIKDGDVYQGSQIHWNYPNEVFKIGSELKKAGINYYNFILDHGAPVMGLVDKERNVMFEGQQFTVKLPELRYSRQGDYAVYLDRPSLFEFRGESNGKRRSSLDESTLITLSLYALSKLLHKYPTTYLPKLDAPLQFWESLDENGRLLLPNLVYRHINLVKPEITETSRTDKDLDKLRRTIDDFIEGVAKHRFHPKRDNCGECRYNVLGMNGKPVCQYRSNRVAPGVPRHYFDESHVRIEEEANEESIIITSHVDQTQDVKIRGRPESITITHDIGRYELWFIEMPDALLVNSTYLADFFGVVYKKDASFESAIITRMDKILTQLARERKKDVVHDFSFNDFDHAGKKRSERTFLELGYKQDVPGRFNKTYSRMVDNAN